MSSSAAVQYAGRWGAPCCGGINRLPMRLCGTSGCRAMMAWLHVSYMCPASMNCSARRYASLVTSKYRLTSKTLSSYPTVHTWAPATSLVPCAVYSSKAA